MKKYASLLLFALLLNGCDDGNLTVDTIDFKDVTSTSCDPTTNTLIYKLKPQEALLLQMPVNSLVNEPTALDTLTYNIDNSSYRVLYRAYDGTVSKSNICDAIPPKSPNVTEEWVGIAGKIKITTKAVYKSPAPDDGHTEIIGYNHNIVFKNITFSKPTGPQVEEIYTFGDYLVTVPAVTVSFSDADAFYCTDTKKVYNDNTTTSLVIENFDTSLFANEATLPGQPRKSLINKNNTLNNVYYRTYTGVLPVKTEDYVCLATPPSTPAVKDTWIGADGVENISGIIEVTTTTTVSSYKHTITLRNATLKKGNSTFKLATEFVLGTVTIAK